MINYYTVLEVSQKASKEQIKEAYKRISLRVHPDKNGGDEYYAEIFKTVNEAQQVLIDEAKRAAYDEELKRSFNYPFGNRPKYFGINLNLNRKWAFLLSLTAGFLTFVILLPSPDLKELEQQKEISAPNSSNSFLNNVDRNKQIQQKLNKVSQMETGAFEGKVNPSNRLTSPTETVALAKNQSQQVNTISKEVPTDIGTSKSEAAITAQKVMTSQPSGPMEKSTVKPGEVQLNELQMMEILAQVNTLRTSVNSNINCVKIRKTKNSNVENAFNIATFFRSKGLIISGREIVYKDLQGVEVVENGPCIFVTIGAY